MAEVGLDRSEGERGEGGDLAQQVFTRLRAAILDLTLLPGERVSERALQGLLQASRTPIREALFQLERDGLILREKRSYRVAPLDRDELIEIFEYRSIVETQAVRLACSRATPERLDAIQAVIDRGLTDPSPETWFRIGSEVHVMLARLSGNRFLARAVEDVVTRIARARWLIVFTDGGRERSYAEHSAIVDLIRRGEPEAAAKAVEAHALAVRDQVMEALTGASGIQGAAPRLFAVAARRGSADNNKVLGKGNDISAD